MLPDIRAVFAAFVAAIGLLMIAFAAVAAFRVAQESRVASLQSDLAQRGQAVPPQTGQRVAVIETPGPHIAPPPPLPVVEVKIAPVGAEVSSIPLLPATQPEPEAAPVAIAAPREEAVPVTEPIGGPLAEPAPARSEGDRAAAKQERARTLAAAKRARQVRLARQRKAAAARRAALARENAKQAATSPFNSGFGSQGPGGFGAASPGFGNSGLGSAFGKQ
jgi:type IV secretory pathway VirB10-like protein